MAVKTDLLPLSTVVAVVEHPDLDVWELCLSTGEAIIVTAVKAISVDFLMGMNVEYIQPRKLATLVKLVKPSLRQPLKPDPVGIVLEVSSMPVASPKDLEEALAEGRRNPRQPCFWERRP